MKRMSQYWLGAVFTLLVGVVGVTGGPFVPTASAAISPVAIQSFGATYGEWSARWWQWLLSIPTATNPTLGGDCAQGQDDDVWFLPGTFGGSATRTCTIPAGKPIFLPLINAVAFKPTGGETLLDLRRLAAAFVDTVNVLDCTIDGTALDAEVLFAFRVHSPSFSVVAPPGALLHASATDPMVSDGYWLLLEPFPPGTTHEIVVSTGTSGGFSADVTYTLTILPIQ